MLIPHSIQLLVIVVTGLYAAHECYQEAKYVYKKSLRRQSKRDKEKPHINYNTGGRHEQPNTNAN